MGSNTIFMLWNQSTGERLSQDVTMCDTFRRRVLGLMFHRTLPEDKVLLFPMSDSTRLGATMHTFFVFFPIAIVWLSHDMQVVDKVVARPFFPWYAPCVPAAWVLEGAASVAARVTVGDSLVLCRE